MTIQSQKTTIQQKILFSFILFVIKKLTKRMNTASSDQTLRILVKRREVRERRIFVKQTENM